MTFATNSSVQAHLIIFKKVASFKTLHRDLQLLFDSQLLSFQLCLPVRREELLLL